VRKYCGKRKKIKEKRVLGIFSGLIQQGGENSVTFSKMAFKTLMIQWGHCCNIGDRDKTYFHHLVFSVFY
jgi:hypothetical protein